MTDIFTIREMSTWHGLSWSVSWKDWGTIKRPVALGNLWDCAFNTGADIVGFAGGSTDQPRALTINASLADRLNTVEDYAYALARVMPIESVAFPSKDQAEMFVEAASKIIEWNLLKRVYD